MEDLWEELVARPAKRPRTHSGRVCPDCQPLLDATGGAKWKRFAMCPHRWSDRKRFGKVKKPKKEKKRAGV